MWLGSQSYSTKDIYVIVIVLTDWLECRRMLLKSWQLARIPFKEFLSKNINYNEIWGEGDSFVLKFYKLSGHPGPGVLWTSIP